MDTKRCSKCGEVKAAGEFYPRRDRRGGKGLKSSCKVCCLAAGRAASAAWYSKNRDRANADRRERRLANLDEERAKARVRDRVRRQTPEWQEYQRAYREQHAERLKEYRSEWARKNPDKVRQYVENASPEARQHSAEYVERRKAEQHAVLDAYKREQGCIDCGTQIGTLDFDHRDGEEKRWNVSQALGCAWETLWDEIAKCDVRCRPCHTRRHALAGDLLAA